MARWIVISLGGSMIAPKEGINKEFLKSFAVHIRELLAEGLKFAIVTGGGAICRTYQEAAASMGEATPENLDWIGIEASRVNAQLVRTLFQEEAAPEIIYNPEEDPLSKEHSIIVGGGWKPGRSTDYDAALLASRLGASRIINMSNISHVYAEDPRENPLAEKFEKMGWNRLLEIIGEEWKPGMNVPFDPIAAKLCQEQSLEVAILSGEHLSNVCQALEGDEFEGTLIKG